MQATPNMLGPGMANFQVNLWLRASTDLGSELCTLHEQQREQDMHRVHLAESIQDMQERGRVLRAQRLAAREINERFSYKRTLFLVALNKVSRWALELKKVVPEKAAAVDAFLKAFEPAKVMRDIHEHDDEYLKGEGRRKDQFRKTVMDGMVDITAVNDLIVNGDILIGGRVSVHGMMKAADDLRAALAPPAMPGQPAS